MQHNYKPNMEGTLYHSEYEHDNCGAGFICSLKGVKSNDIIHKGLEILVKLEHRGAVSSDGRTGDGAGMLTDIPDEFFKKVCAFELPKANEYAVGMIFLPQSENQRNLLKSEFESYLSDRNVPLLGWRKVPVNPNALGQIAKKIEPVIEQVFIQRPEKMDDLDFQKVLFILRRKIEVYAEQSELSEKDYFYIPSLSSKTIIYKGLLMPQDISEYYVDLQDPDFITRMVLVHQRFSTNTFPSWDLAQPFRFMCHNGEINTLRGNKSRMRAREELFQSMNFLDENLKNILPIISEGKSDSATMDMVVELLLLTGRTLPEVMMMMVPEAWEKHQTMSEEKKAFYQYSACIMEPWDGPASIPFTDGTYLGALLDRNGLRPSRYSVTKDGFVIMSSETGVLDIAPENIEYHGRLEPGRMFLVNMDEGKIIDDETIKNEITSKRPYKKWLEEEIYQLSNVPQTNHPTEEPSLDFDTRERIFGYTKEQLETIIAPMMEQGKEPIGSMGNDAPLAVLSNKPQLIYNYFKQLFAQVTNPPLDGIREEIITDVGQLLGEQRNLFDIHSLHARKLKINHPILTNNDIHRIKNFTHPNFKSHTISLLYPLERGSDGLTERLDQLVEEAIEAIEEGAVFIILSDRGVTHDMAPIPALMGVSYLHNELNKRKARSKASIIVESAEPREIHHYACLFGYGASAICPYFIYEVLEKQLIENFDSQNSIDKAIENYQKAVEKGLVKVMNKIGISTLSSYRGAHIFEIIGLSAKLSEKYFPYTTSRIEGADVKDIHLDILHRYTYAFPDNPNFKYLPLEEGGEYKWRRNGEKHMFNPLSIAKLQEAVRLNKPMAYNEYAELINKQTEQLLTLRGLMDFTNLNPIPKDEVEPWTEIVKRFKTGAMSYGSISEEAHQTLAVAMNRLGGKSNSGEGGEFSSRFNKELDGTWKNSAIKQVASGRFGVSSHYLSSAQEIQIKMAQGAKPGEGGQLPGEKVYPWIAECRNSTPWVGLISPPPHHDIYSIEDLAQLIYDLKNANREASINVKLVSQVGVGTVAAGVAKAKAEVILISGYDGGTGASPLTSLKHTGLPWELGLAEAQQTLVMNDLRSRVKLECDGQLKTGRDVAIACLLGAEEFGFATAPLVATGCIMMRACHLNTCPVGIATQNPELRKKFKGKPEHVINFFYYVAEELREIMAQLGFRTIDEMVGQVQKLKQKDTSHFPTKVQGISLDKILTTPPNPSNSTLYKSIPQDFDFSHALDLKIMDAAIRYILRKESYKASYPIYNTNRSVGAIISHEISKDYGADGLEEDTIVLNFTGSAGQSFGLFAAPGLTLILEGNANDYVGKGLSGGKIIIKKPEKSTFKAEDNIIMGNVGFYGGIKGKAFINGKAGERFCVRNSGVEAVVEGLGDHGCEYMTGGKVIVIGSTGRNFAAGMSGGIAYVLDESHNFIETKCNTEMVDFDPLTTEDEEYIYAQLVQHYEYTQSNKADEILNNWKEFLGKFIKVMPKDYKAALEKMKEEQYIQQYS